LIITGLPDDIFSHQKFQFGYNLEGLEKEKKLMAILNILRPFGKFYG
jgi:hypothetical protein